MKKRYLLASLLMTASLTACSKVDETAAASTSTVSATENTSAVTSSYQEGVHYRLVTGINNEGAQKPFLVEYFWLGCPHCQHFEEPLQAYKAKHPELGFVRKHAVIAEHWVNDGRIFYALAQTNNMAHFADLFDLYKKVMTQESFDAFFTRHNIDQEAFLKVAGQDPEVLTKMQQSFDEMNNNKMTSVPSIVVNGQYLIMAHEDLRSNDAYFKLVDYLLTK